MFVATQLADLTGLVAFVDRVCSSVGASADAASDLRLATEEVFVNILQHGYGDSAGSVTVRIGASPERITVTLTDDAPVFDPSEIQAPDLAADCDERRLGGLGWHLVHQVMDEARHERGAQGGNVFTLVKEFPARPPGRRDR